MKYTLYRLFLKLYEQLEFCYVSDIQVLLNLIFINLTYLYDNQSRVFTKSYL